MPEIRPEEIRPGVHRVADGMVNFYLLEEHGHVTLVDAGWPRSWPRIEAAVAAIGRRTGDITAIVLTHAHPDHQGAAERAHKETGAPIYVHTREKDRATGGRNVFALVPGLVPTLWRPSAMKFVGSATAQGFLFPTWSKEVTTFTGGDTLDVPGHPTVVETPGHTEGHVSFLLKEQGVLITGDALASTDPVLNAAGPRFVHNAVNSDPAQVRASGPAIAATGAEVLLFGHGDPYAQGAAKAVERAQEIDAA